MVKAMTVSELARRVLPEANDDELAVVTRQLRHWTVSRVFPDLREGGILTGRGRHRSYTEDAVPLVAVAVELGRWRVQMETIRLALATLHPLLEEPKAESTPEPGALPPVWREVMARKLEKHPERVRPPKVNKDLALWNEALAGKDGIFLVLQVQIALYIFEQIEVSIVPTEKLAFYLQRRDHASTIVVSLSNLFARLR
jgi:hypothetical protein